MSATGRSLVHGSPSECGMSECTVETSKMGRILGHMEKMETLDSLILPCSQELIIYIIKARTALSNCRLLSMCHNFIFLAKLSVFCLVAPLQEV